MLLVNVALPSGKSASLSVPTSSKVEDLKVLAQKALGQAFLTLVTADGHVLPSKAKLRESLEALRIQGDHITAISQQPKLSATADAFALWCCGGDLIVAWGHPGRGGDQCDITEVQAQIGNVQEIKGTKRAFAALQADGSCVTWGAPSWGGNSMPVEDELKNVQQIQASSSAFAAILADGSVVTWGDRACGGDSSTVQDQLKSVQQLQATDRAFAAILADGSVVAWGDAFAGGDNSDVRNKLKNVQQLHATGSAFAAVLADGSVVTWGNLHWGGDSSEVQDQLRNVEQIQATARAFAARLTDRSVITWGEPDCGGDSTKVQSKLKDVWQISGAKKAFAAILENGSVVTWGDQCSGGDSSAVQDQLKAVERVQATASAFAAILTNGSVVTWGCADHGGDSSRVQSQLRKVQQIQATDSAFAAILADGSLVTWGNPKGGGDSSKIDDWLARLTCWSHFFRTGHRASRSRRRASVPNELTSSLCGDALTSKRRFESLGLSDLLATTLHLDTQSDLPVSPVVMAMSPQIVAREFEVSAPLTSTPPEEEGDDEEELLACATCFSTIIYRDDILQDKIPSCKEVVYPYELTVCDRESWCYLVTDQQNHRFDLIRARHQISLSAIRLVASPRADFTWFPGYAWRSAHCEECSASIGWGFCAPFQCGSGVIPTDSESKLWNMAPEFLGLVLTRLRPCSKAKAEARHQQYRESPVQQSYNFVVPPVELPPWWTRTDRGENSTYPAENPAFVDWLDEDPDAAFRRARSPTPPMRVGVRSSTTESATPQEDLDMQSELLRLLREQARVSRSLRMHQFGTPSNVQHIIPRADAVPVVPVAPAEPPTPAVPGAALAAAVQTAVEAAPQMSETSEANDSGLLRWLRRLLQSRRARTPRRREEGSSTQETLNRLRQRRRENSPPNRTWNLIRQLSSQQQQLAAVRDELLGSRGLKPRVMQQKIESSNSGPALESAAGTGESSEPETQGREITFLKAYPGKFRETILKRPALSICFVPQLFSHDLRYHWGSGLPFPEGLRCILTLDLWAAR
eukprot:s271_g2.t1